MDHIRAEREALERLIARKDSKPVHVPAFLGPQVAAQKVAGALLNTSGLPLHPVQCLNPTSTSFGLRFYIPGLDSLGDTAHPIFNPDIAQYGC